MCKVYPDYGIYNNSRHGCRSLSMKGGKVHFLSMAEPCYHLFLTFFLQIFDFYIQSHYNTNKSLNLNKSLIIANAVLALTN